MLKEHAQHASRLRTTLAMGPIDRSRQRPARQAPQCCKMPRPRRCLLCTLLAFSLVVAAVPLLAPTFEAASFGGRLRRYDWSPALPVPSVLKPFVVKVRDRERISTTPWRIPVASLAASMDLDTAYPPQTFEWGARKSPPEWLVRARASLLAQGMSTSELPQVPHLIHQTWKDKVPPKQLFSARWRSALRKANSDWEYRLWTDAENRALVAERYPRFLRMYDGYATAIQRSDAARYFIAHA